MARVLMKRNFVLMMLLLMMLPACALWREEQSTITEGVLQQVQADEVEATRISLSPTKAIEFEYRNKSADTQMLLLFRGVQYPTDALTTGWVEEKDGKSKWGFNLSLPDDLTGEAMAQDLFAVSFLITSQEQLEPTRTGFRYHVRSARTSEFLTSDEYVEMDFSDIINAFTYEVVEFDEQGRQRIVNNSIPYAITTSPTGGAISFDLSVLSFRRGQLISFDPTISIVNVQNYTSVTNNVTCEPYPLCHQTINDSSLRAYYPMDLSTSTTIYDYTNNNLDGTINSLVNCTPGVLGIIDGGCKFNEGINSDDYITIGTLTQFADVCTNGCTFAAWVNISDTAQSKTILGRGDATNNDRFFVFDILASETVSLAISNTGAAAGLCTGAPPFQVAHLNQWVPVVGVLRNDTGTNATILMYVNGTNLANQTCTWQGINVANWLDNESTFIGTNDETSINTEFNGTLDEVMIWNRSLSSAEVMNLYKWQLPRFAGPPALQQFQNISIGQDGTLNNLNVTVNTSLYNNSNLSLIVLEYSNTGVNTVNSSLFYLPHGDNRVANFSISTSTYNVTLLFNYTSGGQSFYSPVLRDTIILTSYATGGGGGMTCTVVSVSSTDYWPCGCNINTTKTSTGSTRFLINGTGEMKINSTITGYTIIQSQGLSTTQQCVIRQYGGVI